MKTYKIRFIGRYKGAIGTTYPMMDYSRGENEREATENLYFRYEHISISEIKEIKEGKTLDRLLHQKTLERFNDYIEGKTMKSGAMFAHELKAIEERAHRLATDYCNGDNGITSDIWEVKVEEIKKEVAAVFRCPVPGLFINGDARGYAIKIDDEVVKKMPDYVGLHRDWGGYGILSPEVEG